MANQPPARPWFRLSSISRPAPPPEPAPTPAPTPAPVARPALIRAITQPQEPIVAPPLPASGPGGGTASLPNSPILRPAAPTASLPTSPVQTTAVVAPAPTTTVVAPAPISTSLPSSPKPRPAAPISSLPPSPILKPAPTSSVPTSPARKIAPTTATFSVPTSPAPKPEPVTSSVTTSPIQRAVTTTTARVPSPAVPSPRTINPEVQTPPASPKYKSTAPPPSPLMLPPAKIRSDAEPEPKIPLEAEQKSVLFQKTVDKSKPFYNGTNQTEKDLIDSIKSGIAHLGKQEASKDGETKEKVHRKKIPSDSEGGGMKVITIAGENKGAFMEVIRSPNKKHVFEGNSYQIHDKGTTRTDGWRSYSSSSSSSSSGEEGKPKLKDKSRNGRSLLSPPMSAFMNSNVQGVNNSIVYNSSYNHHDPGIHLSMSRKPAGGGGSHIKDQSKGYRG